MMLGLLKTVTEIQIDTNVLMDCRVHIEIPWAGDMGSAGGSTTPHRERNTLSKTLGGPYPTWRYQGLPERTDSPRNVDTPARGFLHMRRHVD